MTILYISDIHKIEILKTISIETVFYCNRKCGWCPNKDRQLDRNNVMTEECFERILSEIKEVGFTGEIHPYFRNEPGCDPEIGRKIRRIREVLPDNVVSVNTNGDYGVDVFHEAGAHYVHKNAYDDPNFKQSAHYKVFSNRAGKVSEKPEIKRVQCSLPLLKIMICYNGDIPLCCNDWDCEVKLGNIMERKLIDIWNCDIYRKYRYHHARGADYGKHFALCYKCNQI